MSNISSENNNVNNNNGNNEFNITRLVPIILSAAAIFIAVCFIFGGTGAFGHGISSIFRGLFAGGAYIIPLLLALHALFFKDDYEKKKIPSRVFLSLITLLIASSIDYIIHFWGTTPAFDPVGFYTSQVAGGFIGGTFSFCITSVIGSYGLIILDITVIVVYTIIFFGRKDSTARRGVLKALEIFTSVLAVAEDKVKKNAEKRREEKEEEKRLESERHHAEFLGDQFFESDGSMDELKIRELGIHESRDPSHAEKNPTLHSKVFNKSALSKEELETERKKEEERRKEIAKREKPAVKKVGFDFNIDVPKTNNTQTSSRDDSAAFFENPDIKFGSNNRYDVRENASDVFTKDFDPFDFATGEKLVAKQSTRSVTASKKAPVIDDSTSLFAVTEESIAEMHRREAANRRKREFEARKAEIFGRPAPAPETQETAQTAEPVKAEAEKAEPAVSASAQESKPAPTAPEKTPVSPTIHIPGFSTTTSSAPATTINEPTSIFKPVTVEAITTEATFGTPPEIEEMEYVQVTEDIESMLVDDSNDEEIRKIAESAAWGRPAHTEEEPAEEEAEPELLFGNPEEKDFDTVAEEIAELVRRNNPAYARSANKSIFTTTVRENGEEIDAEVFLMENEAKELNQATESQKASDDNASFVAENISDKALPKLQNSERPSEIVTAEYKEPTSAPAETRVEFTNFESVPTPSPVKIKNFETIPMDAPAEIKDFEISEEPLIELKKLKSIPTETPIELNITSEAHFEIKDFEAAQKNTPLVIEDFEIAQKDEPVEIKNFSISKDETFETENFDSTQKKASFEEKAPEITITDFVPYTPPTVEKTAPAVSEPVLVTERELIAPKQEEKRDIFFEREINNPEVLNIPQKASEPTVTPTIDDALFSSALKSEPVPTALPDETTGTVFEFKDEDSSLEETVVFETEEYKEDEAEELLPIPPEEQNPVVIKQREMFPFLNEETENAPAPEIVVPNTSEAVFEAVPVEEKAPVFIEETVAALNEETPSYAIVQEEEKDDLLSFDDSEEPEEDLPPFEVSEAPKAALVPVEEKPQKKDYSDFVLPPIDLLHAATDERSSDDVAAEIQDNADKLIDTLASFGVTASIKGVDRGPRITRYEVVPARGTKVSSIMNLDNDIALNLAADGIRMEAPIPGKTAVGVEIPNKKASLVRLRELIETDDYRELKSKTTVCMGKDVAGQPIFADVAKMPHALVAGATGMGKSVWINSLMLSILYKARPDEVKFIMIDPKQVEFTMYNGIPHLLVPVVTDVKQAAGTLMWAVEEMERRYGVLQELCVRNIDAYNDKVMASPALGEPMSRIIIVIDEFAELIMQAKNPVESLIIRIAQKARAAGIHLIIGTQKPVKEVITGLIKSNIPSKFSCKVASNRDSILIFDAAGAEKLLDKGDMLVSFANSIKPLRVQSAFVADDEVETVMEYLKSFSDGANYDESVMEEIKRAADKCSKKGGSDRDDDDDDDESYGDGYLNDKQFLSAVEIAVNTGKISTSLIQRKISIGYGKAAKFLDIMEDMGIVGESNGSKPREVLITADEWREKLARTSYD